MAHAYTTGDNMESVSLPTQPPKDVRLPPVAFTSGNLSLPTFDRDPTVEPETPRRQASQRAGPGNELARYVDYGPRASADYGYRPYPDPRRFDRDYVPDRRWERERLYADYYDDELRQRRPARTQSVREMRESRPYPPSSYRPPRASIDRSSPPRRPQYEDDWHSDDADEAHLRPAAGGRGGGGGGGEKGYDRPRENPTPEEVMRLPLIWWMNSNFKSHFVAMCGEFVGTTMFLFFAFAGTQVANVGSQSSNPSNTTTGGNTGFSPEVLLYISLVFAFSLMVNVWIFFRISGGLFNPAVTFGMLLVRGISMTRAILLLVAQIAGSILASFLVKVLFPTPLNVRTTLSSGTSLVRGVFIEAVLTFELVFTIFMLAKEKHKATFIAPVGIGLALFIAELVGVFYTGGSLNPARSFGPCVVTGQFDPEHWIYWVGPATGAIAAVLFYQFVKMLEYETANPDADDNERDQQIKKNGSDPERGVKTEEIHRK